MCWGRMGGTWVIEKVKVGWLWYSLEEDEYGCQFCLHSFLNFLAKNKKRYSKIYIINVSISELYKYIENIVFYNFPLKLIIFSISLYLIF